jgi:hypothetical protein
LALPDADSKVERLWHFDDKGRYQARSAEGEELNYLLAVGLL